MANLEWAGRAINFCNQDYNSIVSTSINYKINVAGVTLSVDSQPVVNGRLSCDLPFVGRAVVIINK